MGTTPTNMSKKYTLPTNCSIERVGTTKRDRAFRLIFQADEGEDYVSEVYVPEKGETIQKAAYHVCLKFDWDRNPPGSKGRLISSLKEFLDWRGCGDDPYRWARAYYKYTDCGPWVNFLELVKPAHEINHPSVVAVLRKVRSQQQGTSCMHVISLQSLTHSNLLLLSPAVLVCRVQDGGLPGGPAQVLSGGARSHHCLHACMADAPPPAFMSAPPHNPHTPCPHALPLR